MHPNDILAAFPDSIRLGAGERVSHAHPLADQVNGRSAALAAASLIYGAGRFPNDSSALISGIKTLEFARALAGAAEPAIITTFDAAATHRPFCALLANPDYRPRPVPAFDVAVRPGALGEGSEIEAGAVTVAPGLAEALVMRYARNIFITRSQIVNDRHDVFLAMARQVGATGARMEGERVADALGANPVLDDGVALFDATRLNVIASALDATTLAQAMASLRNQLMPAGGAANLDLAHLVVEPALELAARKLVHESGLAASVRVAALPGLATGRWFALADPRIAPVVGVVVLDKPGGRGIPIQMRGLKAPPEVDAAALRIEADLGATLLSPIGVIRGGV